MGRYGDTVRVEYIDLLSPQGASFPNAWGVITAHNLVLPVVTVNDRVRLSGALSLTELDQEAGILLGYGGVQNERESG
ncbi:MAG: hypothetical protein ACYC9Q_13595 [Bacillota bacterium]